MGETSKIQWTDSGHSSWVGCTRISPACDRCYAARSTPARVKGVSWGPGQPRVLTAQATRQQPRRWNRKPYYECQDCAARGTATELGKLLCTGRAPNHRLTVTRRRVFALPLADWLDLDVPIEWLCDLLDTVRETPELDWQLLTKRIGNLLPRLRAAAAHSSTSGNPALAAWLTGWLGGRPPRNVWLGITVVTQAEADRDIPKLLAAPAWLRFLSLEPLLSNISLTALRTSAGALNALAGANRIDWVILGGESGSNARPLHPSWVRSIRDQCSTHGTAFFFKQWGGWLPHSEWPQVSGFPVAPRKDWMVLCPDGAIDVPDGYFPEEQHGLYAIAPLPKKDLVATIDRRTWLQMPSLAAA